MEKESFYKLYMKVALPVMLQGVITTLVSMIDNLMVGQLGDVSISAVSVATRVINIIMFTLFGVTAATGVFIAQYFGAKNVQKQKEVFRISLLLSIAITVGFLIFLVIFPTETIHFFVKDATIEQLAVDYLLIMLIGFVPYTLSINYAVAMRVIGEVRAPLIASLVGVVVNTCLNYAFIFGNFGAPILGVKGAAIATVVARFVEFILIYSYSLYKKFDFNTKWYELLHVPKDLFKVVFKRSLPLIVNELIWSFSQAMILKLYAEFGGEVIAAISVLQTTSEIFFSFSRGMSAATPVFVSQKLGANQFKEAYSNAKKMVQMSAVMGVILGVGMWLCSYLVPNLYQISMTTHTLATQMIQIASLIYWVNLVNTQCYFVLRAGGEMTSTLLIDGGFNWVVILPSMAISIFYFQLPVILVFIVAQLCELLKMGASLKFFFRRNWVQNLT